MSLYYLDLSLGRAVYVTHGKPNTWTWIGGYGMIYDKTALLISNYTIYYQNSHMEFSASYIRDFTVSL